MQVHRYHFIALFLLLLLGMPSSLLGQVIPPKTRSKEYRFLCVHQYIDPVTREVKEITYPSCTIRLFNSYYSKTGGHLHDNTGRTKGNNDGDSISRLSLYQGSYVNSEGLPFTITTSRVGQDEWYSGCFNRPGSTDPRHVVCYRFNFTVKYSNISSFRDEIKNSKYMAPIGHDKPGITHTENHNGTTKLKDALKNIAKSYHDEFACRVGVYKTLGINDMALPYGGVFDYQNHRPWRPGHKTHDRGNAVDFRYHKVGDQRHAIIYEETVRDRFEELCEANGLHYFNSYESLKGTAGQHIHCGTNSSGT